MNKLVRLIALLIFAATIGVQAQESAGTPAADYPVLTSKLKKSESALTDPKKSGTAKFWLSRADLMMDIFHVNLQHISKGFQKFNIKLIFGEPKEVKTEEKDGIIYETGIYDNINITFVKEVVDSYVETNKIYENSLEEALNSLKKAEELDVDKKLNKKIIEAYIKLRPLLERDGLELYIAEHYEDSYKSFAKSVEINGLEMLNQVIDTTIIYNTGMIAAKAGLTEESIKYYEIARANNYPEPVLYIFLKNKYFELADTAKGLEVLKDGFEKHPESSDIVIELINYYLLNDQAEEALNYIKIAQEKDPTNISLIFAEATLYDKSGEFDKAIEIYKQAIAKDPTFFNGYFNLGVVYYNQAQKLYESAVDIPTKEVARYDAQMKQADEILLKAVEPMEKCRELKPEDTSVLDVLKTIYYRLRNSDPVYLEKYKDVKAALEG